MGTREHGRVRLAFRDRRDRFDHAVDGRQQIVVAGIAQHLRIGEVVDVLGRAAEVDELVDVRDLFEILDLVAQVILDRLHVMVGRVLDRFHLLAFADIEIRDHAFEVVGRRLRQRLDIVHLGFRGECLQPADLDDQPVADQTVFAADLAQIPGFVGVSAVDWGNRRQRCELHGHGHASVKRAVIESRILPNSQGVRRSPRACRTSTRPGSSPVVSNLEEERSMAPQDDYRIEKDSMGELQVPTNALWGAQSQRAVDNFPISDLRAPRAMINALGLIKASAAEVNRDLELLDADIAQAIIDSATAVAEGLRCGKSPSSRSTLHLGVRTDREVWPRPGFRLSQRDYVPHEFELTCNLAEESQWL